MSIRAKLVGAVLALALAVVTSASAVTPTLAPAAARIRVAHHVREVERLAAHFQGVLSGTCPRFPSADAWDTYAEAETERIVLLMAHLEQAWVEAKRTDDDDVRRSAKAPRRQGEQGRQLIEKLQACAEANNASFAPFSVWRRIEREVPERQAEIALPD